MSNRRGKLLYLESIRGLAACIVVVGHLLYAFAPFMHEGGVGGHSWLSRVMRSTPWCVFYNGHFSVVVFFVLSGVVLSYSTFSKNEAALLSSAACRRYFRLTLPIAFSVGCSFLLLRFGLMYFRQAALVMHGPDGAASWLGTLITAPPSIRFALREALYGALLSYQPLRTFNNVMWTMPIEFAGSYFVFGLLALFDRVRNRGLIYSVLGVALIGSGRFYMASFLAGIILCEYLIVRPDHDWPPVCGWILMLAGLCLGGVRADVNLPIRFARSLEFWNMLGAVLLIGGVSVSAPLRRGLEGRMALFLGRISFALYLLHLLVLGSVGCFAYIRLRGMGISHIPASVAASTVTVAISVLVSAWAAQYVDQPSIMLGKWVYARFFKPLASNSSPVGVMLR